MFQIACLEVLIKTAHIIMDVHCLGICFRFKVSSSDQGGKSNCHFELLLEVNGLSRCEDTTSQGMERWIIGTRGKEICLACFCQGL